MGSLVWGVQRPPVSHNCPIIHSRRVGSYKKATKLFHESNKKHPHITSSSFPPNTSSSSHSFGLPFFVSNYPILQATNPNFVLIRDKKR